MAVAGDGQVRREPDRAVFDEDSWTGAKVGIENGVRDAGAGGEEKNIDLERNLKIPILELAVWSLCV
jgi:hypothetical protein